MKRQLNQLCVLLVMTVAVSISFGAEAQPAGTSPDDLVTITGRMFGAASGCGNLVNAFPLDNRTLSDGTTDHAWTIPAGHTFVATHFSWTIRSDGALGGGADTIFLHLLSAPPFDRSIIMVDTADPGLVSDWADLGAVAMRPGTTLCLSKSGAWDFAFAEVHGYLVADGRAGRP